MIKQISESRPYIMGLAIFFILIYHIVPKPVDIQHLYLMPFQVGCVGVDMFLFVSGFGLYYSWTKNSELHHFYKSRFLRVWLPFIIYMVFYTAFFNKGILFFLREASLLDYFIGKIFLWWYIPCIIIFYALFPLMYKIIKTGGVKFSC